MIDESCRGNRAATVDLAAYGQAKVVSRTDLAARGQADGRTQNAELSPVATVDFAADGQAEVALCWWT